MSRAVVMSLVVLASETVGRCRRTSHMQTGALTVNVRPTGPDSTPFADASTPEVELPSGLLQSALRDKSTAKQLHALGPKYFHLVLATETA